MELAHSRLVYLISKHQVSIPRQIARHLPGSDWLTQLHLGLGAAASELDIPLKKVTKAYEEGKALGPGSSFEARKIIAQMVMDEMDRKDLDLTDRIAVTAALDRFMTKSELVEEEEVDLSDVEIPEAIPKFKSGFTPLDLVLDDCYQGLYIIMARPGTGKTSVLLSIQEAFVKQGTPTLFVESEISKSMMLGRMKPILDRTPYTSKDRLVCGGWSAKELLEYVREHPDPNRVVFFDGPDAVGGAEGTDRRFQLERAYQDLVRVKTVSRAVFVSSQPRRNDSRLSISSTAESWAKAWYADVMLALDPIPSVSPKLRFRVVKNRFGPNDQQVTFDYNLVDLSWKAPFSIDEDEW